MDYQKGNPWSKRAKVWLPPRRVERRTFPLARFRGVKLRKNYERNALPLRHTGQHLSRLLLNSQPHRWALACDLGANRPLATPADAVFRPEAIAAMYHGLDSQMPATRTGEVEVVNLRWRKPTPAVMVTLMGSCLPAPAYI
jgi:hypothetical protein